MCKAGAWGLLIFVSTTTIPHSLKSHSRMVCDVEWERVEEGTVGIKDILPSCINSDFCFCTRIQVTAYSYLDPSHSLFLKSHGILFHKIYEHGSFWVIIDNPCNLFVFPDTFVVLPYIQFRGCFPLSRLVLYMEGDSVN